MNCSFRPSSGRDNDWFLAKFNNSLQLSGYLIIRKDRIFRTEVVTLINRLRISTITYIFYTQSMQIYTKKYAKYVNNIHGIFKLCVLVCKISSRKIVIWSESSISFLKFDLEILEHSVYNADLYTVNF